MAITKKYYVVWVGKKPGIYKTWGECLEQTRGLSGARFKSFPTMMEAEEAFKGVADTPINSSEAYVKGSISVDAACAGNPGVMEYKGVWTDNGEVIFHSEIYPVGTNNIGEFLALVDALKYSKEKNENYTIYTDSQTALAWLRNKKAKSTLERNERTENLWFKLDDAIEWLANNNYSNQVLKWETKKLGEIKADFGRKNTSKK